MDAPVDRCAIGYNEFGQLRTFSVRSKNIRQIEQHDSLSEWAANLPNESSLKSDDKGPSFSIFRGRTKGENHSKIYESRQIVYGKWRWRVQNSPWRNERTLHLSFSNPLLSWHAFPSKTFASAYQTFACNVHYFYAFVELNVLPAFLRPVGWFTKMNIPPIA